jgi:hypothetical protein
MLFQKTMMSSASIRQATAIEALDKFRASFDGVLLDI